MAKEKEKKMMMTHQKKSRQMLFQPQLLQSNKLLLNLNASMSNIQKLSMI